ncbi:SDR family NAD(P)-dependent oxidoreductase [Halovulum dunhuangense]|uniref:SDR family NAD(P)-dependent oxidoreductase n=1 Tax=Halovulum dunhuangense TaxID=1505036 RepID=A0A849L641_9RHOB|nr:SDR family NAD(P)-dependent oxidoreductase [Halovulum dunhuangense]NNU81879.1 SDR family NAD(P)-dependent oxidoreductase [Halovulum dunhuangense]
MTEKIALVTGASRGFGYAVALELAQAGWHVVALARTTGGLEELADAVDRVGGAVTLVPLDITDDAGLARMGRAIFDRWGRLDLMVHAAAHATPCAPVELAAVKDLDRAIAVNFRATQRLIAMCDPLLKAAPGARAVYVVDSHAGAPFFGAYGATKAAARTLVESWAAETAKIGPKVQIFQPAPMPTALRARFFPGEDRAGLSTPAAEAARLMASLG